MPWSLSVQRISRKILPTLGARNFKNTAEGIENSLLLNGMQHSTFFQRNLSHLACSTSPRCAATSQKPSTRGYTVYAAANNSSDLKSIRGVGPVNEARLRAHQINTIEHLQQIYHRNFKADQKSLEHFLYDQVKIRNPRHCKSIAEHVDTLNWAEYQPSVKLAVEGNIGAGKSTFLNIMTDIQLELQDIIEIVPEPVDEWQSVKQPGSEKPINLLEQFYKDPKRYAYTFQHYVLLTRVQKDRNARASSKPLKVLERSIFSDRMVFVRAMHEAGFMPDLELSIYDSWFNMEITHDRDLTPNGFIYLKAKPETCIKRLRSRNRSEEAGVSEDYLANLHDKHESWLYFGARGLTDYVTSQESKIFETVSKLQSTNKGLAVSPHLHGLSRDGSSLSVLPPHTLELMKSAPESIRDKIVLLGNNDMEGSGDTLSQAHMESLRGVPALILDHDQDDIMHDQDARKDYASKVKEFSDFVSKLQTSKLLVPQPAVVQRAKAERFDALQNIMTDLRSFKEEFRSRDLNAAKSDVVLAGIQQRVEELLRSEQSMGAH